jgi:dCMP deaminase
MEIPQNYLDAIGPEFTNYVPPTWDVLFMKMAYLAATKSKDTRTKIGAFVVGPNNEPISFGFNGFPRKVDDSKLKRFDRPLKYLFTEHAERNSLYTLPRTGATILPGSKMYTNGIPCADCGRGIIQVGITEVIVHEPWEIIFHYLYNTWTESCNTTVEMFEESGVKVRYIKEFIGSDSWIDGKIIHV